MPDSDDAVPESPSTWENVVTGEAKKVVGRLVGDEELAEEGDEQIEIARKVREEFRDEHDH
jgi:uncharacterized protein YjbJ (UPF0337 family)